MSKIIITGKNIIGCDGEDHTGALKELGIKYRGYSDKEAYSRIYSMKFKVDLDFVLRHGCMDENIYDKHYKKSKEYKKYYEEGAKAFLDSKNDPLDNPYIAKTIKDKDYWLDDLMVKGYPWYDGYRETESNFSQTKYKLKEMQDEIREIVKRYGLKIEYTDEYCTPYAVTPEGYQIQLA